MSHAVPLPWSLGILSILCIKPYLYKYKICHLTLLLVNILWNWWKKCLSDIFRLQTNTLRHVHSIPLDSLHKSSFRDAHPWLCEEGRLLNSGAPDCISVWYLKQTVSKSCIRTNISGYLSIALLVYAIFEQDHAQQPSHKHSGRQNSMA